MCALVANLCKTGYVQVLAMIHGGFARLPGPRPLPLCVRETGPGEDVVIRQVQIGRVHSKLTDQLQKTRKTVQQPLQRKKSFPIFSVYSARFY